MEEDGIGPSPSVQFHVETLFISVLFTEPVRSSEHIVFICRMIIEQWTEIDIEGSKIGLI
jgi:hypothetical protein